MPLLPIPLSSILVHAVYALLITIQNRRSNGRRYEYDRRSVSSKWYSRKMGLLGTIILLFLIIHLRDFWYHLQFGHVPLDKDGQKELYTLVVSIYQNVWYVLIYVLCMAALGYHLLHGFFSAKVYRLAECSAQLIDQAVAQGVPFAREYSGPQQP